MSGPRDISHTFTGAGEVQHQIAGRFVRILAADGSVYIRLDGGSELNRSAGQEVDNGRPFTRINFRSTIAQTVQIVISDTPQDDNTQTLNATVSATVGPGNTYSTTSDKSIGAGLKASLLGGSATRLSITIKNLAGNAAPIRVGDTNISATRGHELSPGESISLACDAEIFAFNTHSGAQSVSLLIVSDV